MAELPDMDRDLMYAASRELLLKKVQDLLDSTVKSPRSFKEITNLSIHKLKGLSAEDSELISQLLKVKTIRDLAKVHYKQLVNNLTYFREAGIPRKKIELIITAAKYIVNAATYKPVEGQKVVLAGLDNAGKTALVKVIMSKFADLSSLKPTQGVDRQAITLKDQEIYIYELGGQEIYRKLYIERPEKYVIGVDILVFLIDMQDGDRYQEALKYLEQILRIITYLNENPDFIILLHKSDPEIFKIEPLFQEKLDYMSARVKEVFGEYNFLYEIQISSIYHTIAPSFPKLLSGLFTGELEKEDQLKLLAKTLTDVVEMVLAIESKFSGEMTSIKHNLNRLVGEVKKISDAVVAMVPEALPEPTNFEEIFVIDPEYSKSETKSKSALVDELKRIFVKKE